ncbi:MAG: DNA polymerase I [bacterium]|nr:DNA polymerase I [bacterium]
MSEKSERPRLYLIDGYANIFRAYYAIRDLSSSKGEPTNATYGFFQMLRKLLRDAEPEYIGVALDVSSDTVRRERYEEYKANRAPMPEDLVPQVPWIRRLIAAHKIPLLELPRYEADDVLGTLARKAVAEGFEVVLVSSDKDLMQLVGDGVYLYHTGRDKLYDPQGVTEDFGVPPTQVIDVLALMGDSVDNVPGVPGIGEKGAKKLVAEYGSLDELFEHAAEIKRKSYREALQNHRDKALLSKELVTIHTDLPVDFDPEALRREKPDYEELLEICWELDFQKLAKELEASHGKAAEPVPPAVRVVSAAEWGRIATKLEGEIHLAVVGEESPLGMAVLDAAGQACYADFHRDELAAAVRESLHGWVADPDVTLVGHDLKEVLRLLGSGLDLRCRLFDTMLGSYLLVSLRNHTLDDVALDRLRRTPITAQEAGWVKGVEPAAGAPALLAYAAERVELPRQMVPKMREELDAESLTAVYESIEEPLVPVLAGIEETGIALDVEYLERMSHELEGEIAALEEEIYKLAGERFNINSPRQLGEIMFEKLGYPVLGRTRKTKSYATGAETLEELAARGFDLPVELLRYRELSKLQSTYVDALPALVAADGRLHTRFNQAVAATGRLSSTHPNLQNIPIRTELGHRIRKAFLAAEGHRLIVADYSQIELRVLAHIAEEEAMIKAFRAGEDIHAATAAAVFGMAPLLVNPDQRRMAKTINFGIIYGMSDWGLGRQLGIAKKEAGVFIRAYMERYPGVKRYTEETLEAARETARVETLYGRIRWLPDIRSRNYSLRENAKRMAINARIQGTAADLLKLAMIAVDRRLRREERAARLLLTVHDELVLEAPEEEVAAVSETVREEMEGVTELCVPLVVDVGSGPNWYEAKS